VGIVWGDENGPSWTQTALQTRRGIADLTETIRSHTSPRSCRRSEKVSRRQMASISTGPTATNAHEGRRRMAFGEGGEAQYYFRTRAGDSVAATRDFLFAHPEGLRYTRQFTKWPARESRCTESDRLYKWRVRRPSRVDGDIGSLNSAARRRILRATMAHNSWARGGGRRILKRVEICKTVGSARFKRRDTRLIAARAWSLPT